MPLAASTPLLDDFLVVALRGKELELLYSFTGGTGEAAARTSAVKQFCFPDVEDTTSLSLQSESFTLTLTEDDGSRCFGFSRRLASLGDLHRPVCLCVLSRRPWFSLFMHMLDIAQRAGERAEHDCIGGFIPAFVAAATAARLPPPGGALAVSAGDFGSHRLYAPYDDERPTGVSFEPLLSALGVPNTVRLLGALLLEQRVIFVGSRWGHVSSCAHAALTLLYPLTWQHIFIPVLPTAMLSYACAPMPYVLGLLARHAPALAKEPVEEEVLYVHLETGKVAGGAEPSDEAPSLPRPISQALERSLGVHLRNGKKSRLDNQAVADAVLNLCMVQLLGHYRRCLAPPPPPAAPPARERRDGLHPRMDDEAFFSGAPQFSQPFLRAMRSSQLLEAFVREYADMSDESRKHSAFERACAAPLAMVADTRPSARGELLSRAASAAAAARDKAATATSAAEQRFGPALAKAAKEATAAAAAAQQWAGKAAKEGRASGGRWSEHGSSERLSRQDSMSEGSDAVGLSRGSSSELPHWLDLRPGTANGRGGAAAREEGSCDGGGSCGGSRRGRDAFCSPPNPPLGAAPPRQPASAARSGGVAASAATAGDVGLPVRQQALVAAATEWRGRLSLSVNGASDAQPHSSTLSATPAPAASTAAASPAPPAPPVPPAQTSFEGSLFDFNDFGTPEASAATARAGSPALQPALVAVGAAASPLEELLGAMTPLSLAPAPPTATSPGLPGLAFQSPLSGSPPPPAAAAVAAATPSPAMGGASAIATPPTRGETGPPQPPPCPTPPPSLADDLMARSLQGLGSR